MTPAYDIERVATACDDLTRAIAAALVHSLPDWMGHRLHTMHAEASALVAILRQHAPDAQAVTVTIPKEAQSEEIKEVKRAKLSDYRECVMCKDMECPMSGTLSTIRCQRTNMEGAAK